MKAYKCPMCVCFDPIFEFIWFSELSTNVLLLWSTIYPHFQLPAFSHNSMTEEQRSELGGANMK
jgi:hypothetical protein